MNMNENSHPLDCLTDWMEHLESMSLDELRQIRRALDHDVEAGERQFLDMLNKSNAREARQRAEQAEAQLALGREAKAGSEGK
jgi:hypothetical protein